MKQKMFFFDDQVKLSSVSHISFFWKPTLFLLNDPITDKIMRIQSNKDF